MTRGYANANYRLETSAGVFLLRNALLQDRAAVEYEVNVLDHLRTTGFPAPAALRFAEGERWIDGPGGTHVMLLEWLDGSEPVPGPSTVASIARALARLHRLSPPVGEWWRRENPIGMSRVEQLCRTDTPRLPELFRFFVEEFARLRDRVSTPLPAGLIHGDVFPDNTLFRGDEELVAMLDFQDASEDAFLFDVAMTIHGFCFPGEKWAPELATTLIESYSALRPLSCIERELLPAYLRWCPLTMTGWHLRQLLRRPNRANEERAAQFARRIQTMRNDPLMV